MTSVPRYRATAAPALFSQGFRPFFLAGAAWSAMAVALWLPMFEGRLPLPTAFDPLTWHAHEMLFGFVAAVIAGFLLTAIPNWTGRLPLQGAPLIGLCALWLLGRIAVAASSIVGPLAAALCDLSFLAALLALVLRELLAGRNWRNLPMPAALAVLLVANALIHGEALGWSESGAEGKRLAIAVVTLLIALIGGRIVPSFTRNWLARRGAGGLPAVFGAFDRACLLITGAALLLWVFVPDEFVTGLALIAAGIANAVRLARWHGRDTGPEPLVWVLHLGFAGVPAGLLLLGLAPLADWSTTAGLHALSTGAFGTMTLAVMTRASLGHTGREVTAGRAGLAIYVAVTAAAVLRIAAAMLPLHSLLLFGASGVCWVAAFGGFAIAYGRLLASR